jgi:hypothetical protein
MPAGDARIYTLVSTAGPGANFILPGLCLSNTVTPGTGSQAVFWNGWHTSVTATWAAGVQVGSNFSQASPTLTGITTTTESVAILRITRSGSTYTFGVSRIWFEKVVAIGFTATHMGLILFNSSGFTAHVAWEFFRYYGSATANTGGAP